MYTFFSELIYFFMYLQLSSHPLRQLLIASPFIRYKWSLQPLEQGSGRNLSMLSNIGSHPFHLMCSWWVLGQKWCEISPWFVLECPSLLLRIIDFLMHTAVQCTFNNDATFYRLFWKSNLPNEKWQPTKTLWTMP